MILMDSRQCSIGIQVIFTSMAPTTSQDYCYGWNIYLSGNTQGVKNNFFTGFGRDLHVFGFACDGAPMAHKIHGI